MPSSSNSNASAPTSHNAISASNLSSDAIIGIVKTSLQPDIEKRLEARKQLDEAAIQGILKLTKSSSKSDDPEPSLPKNQ